MAVMKHVQIDVSDIQLVRPDGQREGLAQPSLLQLVVLMRHRH